MSAPAACLADCLAAWRAGTKRACSLRPASLLGRQTTRRRRRRRARHRLPPCPPLGRSFTFTYAVGSQLARYVRLTAKLQTYTPVSFVAGFILSSTVLWQAIDSLLCVFSTGHPTARPPACQPLCVGTSALREPVPALSRPGAYRVWRRCAGSLSRAPPLARPSAVLSPS